MQQSDRKKKIVMEGGKQVVSYNHSNESRDLKETLLVNLFESPPRQSPWARKYPSRLECYYIGLDLFSARENK